MTWCGSPLVGIGRRAAGGRLAGAGTTAALVAEIGVAAVIALVVTGCEESATTRAAVPAVPAVPAGSTPASSRATQAATSPTTAHVTVRDVVLDVEVADTPYRQVRGLSGRDSLAPRSGMLFSFGIPTSGGFYMFQTRMPLSIMFVGDDDRVVDVTEMTPCLTDLPTDCPVYYAAAPYTYAVEAAAGTFTGAGVGPGDVVSVDRG